MNPRVFGLDVRGEDEDGSDLDVLLDTRPDTPLLDIGIIQDALVRLLGVDVDVLTPKGLPETFRAAAIAEAVGSKRSRAYVPWSGPAQVSLHPASEGGNMRHILSSLRYQCFDPRCAKREVV